MILFIFFSYFYSYNPFLLYNKLLKYKVLRFYCFNLEKNDLLPKMSFRSIDVYISLSQIDTLRLSRVRLLCSNLRPSLGLLPNGENVFTLLFMLFKFL